jgi:hypothetical protein
LAVAIPIPEVAPVIRVVFIGDLFEIDTNVRVMKITHPFYSLFMRALSKEYFPESS